MFTSLSSSFGGGYILDGMQESFLLDMALDINAKMHATQNKMSRVPMIRNVFPFYF
jgi:hypothetical protein